MEADLTCWVGILLHCEVFQSYQSIVAPNESIQTRRAAKQKPEPIFKMNIGNKTLRS